MWLDNGKIRAIGETELVVSKYLAYMVEKDSQFLGLSRKEGVSGQPPLRYRRRRSSPRFRISTIASAMPVRRSSG